MASIPFNPYFTYKDAMWSLNLVGIGKEHYDQKINTLSGGQKLRFRLACFLANPKPILFADEVTTGLDRGNQSSQNFPKKNQNILEKKT